MKAIDILKRVLVSPQIAEDCHYFNLLDSESIEKFNEQFRLGFGEEVCEIITSQPKDAIKEGTYMYGYSGTHIMECMPDIILVLHSDDTKDDGKCIFLWRIDDDD